MLVLTRKKEETLHIGEDVVITVVKCTDGSVRLGIDAPRGVRVMRGEVLERDRQQGRAA